MENNPEEINKIEEDINKKKKRKKAILIFLLVIFIIAGLYASTVIVKKINVSKLGNDYCEYNGEHPIQTGMKGENHSTCKGCSKIMKFDYKIPD